MFGYGLCGDHIPEKGHTGWFIGKWRARSLIRKIEHDMPAEKVGKRE
jgi:hypothetical protein